MMSVGIPVVRMHAHILRHFFDVVDHTATSSIFGAEHLIVLATRMDIPVKLRPVPASLVPDGQRGSLVLPAVVHALVIAVLITQPLLDKNSSGESRKLRTSLMSVF